MQNSAKWEIKGMSSESTYLALMRKCNRKGAVSISRPHLLIVRQRLVLTLHHEVLDQAVHSGVNVLRLDVPEDRRANGGGLRRERWR